MGLKVQNLKSNFEISNSNLLLKTPSSILHFVTLSGVEGLGSEEASTPLSLTYNLNELIITHYGSNINFMV
jgi:hypothetical protein